jgi:hypothetical protein
MELRFNHMEITLPKGTLTPEFCHDVEAFYGDVYGFTFRRDVAFNQQCLYVLRNESDFLLLIEGDHPMSAPGFDHLGFELGTLEDVHATYAQVQKWHEKDDRIQIYEFAEGPLNGRYFWAYYVRYLLPIWFDIQFSEPVAAE